MARVRVRKDNNLLFMDFYFRGVRCREQTALPDTATNRKRVQILMNRIEREIQQGEFDYTATFPNSPRAARFAKSNVTQHGLASATTTTRAVSSTQSDLPPDQLTPTFLEFSILWRQEMAPQWRRLHHKSVDAIFETHLLPSFGDKPLSKITKPDVLAFRAELAKRPGRSGKRLAPSTINKIMGILRQCLTEASERYGVVNSFSGIRRLKARRTDVEPFSLEEVEQIRATIRADYLSYVTVRFFTGLRTGEINGLKWKHVDFEQQLIFVREVFSSGITEEDAKTQESLRDIPMLPIVKEALEAQWAQRHPTSEYVYATRDGAPINANNFANRVWYPLLHHLGLKKRRPYNTRHTTATLMLASGENPEWIARLMGHVNTQMLFTVYSRFVPNLTRQDGLAITGFLAKSGNSSSPKPQEIVLSMLKSITPEQIDKLDTCSLRALLKHKIAG